MISILSIWPRARALQTWSLASALAKCGLILGLGAVAACGFIAGIEDLQSVPADAAVDAPLSVEAPTAFDASDAGVAQVDARDATADATTDVTDAATMPDTSPACDGGIVCNGLCVNPASDPSNCNGCGNVCATGTCGSSIVADMSTQPPSWQFNGTAEYDHSAPSGVLTVANVTEQAGTIVYMNPVTVDAFDATFQFRMGLEGGTRSDGMGFMFERSGSTAVGASGGALGMVGLDGYGVELDIFDNGMCGDPSADHVGIDSLSLCNPSVTMPTSFTATDLTGMIDLADASWHTATVTLGSGALTVTVDGTVVAMDVTLGGFQSGTPYYFGFGGGTGLLVTSDGGGGYRTEVKDIAIKFPTPRCL